MTLLPIEPQRIGAGKRGDKIERPFLCQAPDCMSVLLERHHVVRRSFLGGDYEYVEINGIDTPNIVWLCNEHHRLVTEGRATFQWFHFQGEAPGWEYRDGAGVANVAYGIEENIDVDCNMHDHATSPGRCPACRRPLPKPKDPNIKARPRVNWTVKVPVDARENGVEIIEELLWACAQRYGRDEHRAWRYYTLIQALAEVVQGEVDRETR